MCNEAVTKDRIKNHQAMLNLIEQNLTRLASITNKNSPTIKIAGLLCDIYKRLEQA